MDALWTLRMADRKSDDRGLSCSQSQQSVMDLLLHLHCKRIREISESESSLLGLENSGYPVSLTISFSVLGACLQTQSQCTLLFERVALQSVTEETLWPVRFPCSWGYKFLICCSFLEIYNEADTPLRIPCGFDDFGLALCAHRLFMTCWSRGARIHPRQARQVLLQTEKWRVLKMALWHTLTVFVSIRFFVIIR